VNNRIWLIVGKSGCGKSWFGRYILTQYLQNQAIKYAVVIDNSSDHFYGGLQTQGFFLQEYGEVEAQRSYNWENFIKANKKVLLEITNLKQDEITRLMDDISKALYNLGDSLILVDEAHIFFPYHHHSIEFERLLRGGRKKGIDVIMITQTLVDLNLIALRLANILILFQITEANELERARQYFQVDKEEIFNLRDREYFFKDMKTSHQIKDTTQGLDNF